MGEGSWIERIVGAESGRVVYRHSRLPDGGWLIEEQHAAAVPRRHVERRNSRLILDPDFKLQSCAYTVDSFAGWETGRITWAAPGEYVVQVKELDGWESQATVVGDRMLPSERLTVTLWPLLLAQRRPAPECFVAPALDVAADGVALRDISLAVKDPGQPGSALEVHWQLKVDRPTHSTEQVYRLTRDGSFLGMQEMMPLLWLRELVPVG